MLRGELDLASDAEYKRLLDRRSSIVSSLRSVNGHISRLGLSPLSQGESLSEEIDRTMLRRQLMTTTRSGRLSWRGLELAHALFDAYEVNGRLNVAAYLSDLGRDDQVKRCNLEEFVQHREEIEAQRPIEADMLALGFVAMPLILHRWKKYGRTFDSFEGGSKVSVEHFKQLCFECDASAGSLLLKTHLDHNVVCSSVRDDYARRHRVFGCAQTSRVMSDREFLYRDAFLAFLFSGRPNDQKGCASLFSDFVRGFRTFLRQRTNSLSRALHTLSTIVARGFLPPGRTCSAKAADAATLNVSVLVGDGGGRGAGVEVRYALVDPVRFSTEKKLPKNVGSCVLIDLAIRSGTERKHIMRLKKQFVVMFKRYVENDFKKFLPGFFGIRLVHVETTFRVQLLWRQDATLDSMLLRRKIYAKASDFFQECRASLRFAMSLTELLSSAGEPLELEASCSLSYARDLISLLLEEVLYHRKEERKREEMEQGIKRAAHHKAIERTIASHGRITDNKVDDLIGITGYVEEIRTDTVAMERHRNQEDAQSESHLWRFLRLLRGSKHLQFEFAFGGIGDLLFNNAMASTLLGRHQRRALQEALSNIDQWWKQVISSMSDEMDKLWNKVRNVEEAEAKRGAARDKAEAERLANMSETERKREAFDEEKKKLLQSMKREDDIDRTLAAAAAAAADEVEEAKRLRDALEFYELCCTAFVGPLNVTIQSSNVTLSVEFDGMDIFDNLP